MKITILKIQNYCQLFYLMSYFVLGYSLQKILNLIVVNYVPTIRLHTASLQLRIFLYTPIFFLLNIFASQWLCSNHIAVIVNICLIPLTPVCCLDEVITLEYRSLQKPFTSAEVSVFEL